MEVHIGSSSAVVPDSLQFILLGYNAPTVEQLQRKTRPPVEVGTIEYIHMELSAY